MRKSAFIVLALLLVSVPATAGSFGIFGASYSPSDTDTGEGVGLDMEFGSGRWGLQLRASLFEELTTDANPETYEIEAAPYDLGVNYRFAQGSRVTPHVGGGATYAVFHFDGDVTQTVGLPNSADIDPELGFYLEVGVQFSFARNAAVFADAVVRNLEAEVEGDDVGLDLDQFVDMSGVALHVGVAVVW
jgi:opacity protein-like surface antigen